MNKYIFYLRPPMRQRGHLSLVYFSVIIAANLTKAVRKFAMQYNSNYCGFMQLASHKSEVYYTQGNGADKAELVYVVIEEKHETAH